MSDTTTTVDTDAATPTFEKGSWQDHLNQSAKLLDRSTTARKRASALLWQGAQEGIESWLPEAATDVQGENLYGEILLALGTARKGDASKIKTVALAVRNNGLILATYPNLSKAYAEATRLTKTVAAEKDEDDAAEKAIEALAENAPKSTTSVEGAAQILLAKGIDGAVVAILDALGANNEAAHRAFMRAVSTEIAARVQAAKPKPAPKAGPKAGATQASTGTAATRATVKDGATKAKPKGAAAVGTKAKPVPVSATKGDANKRVLPAKAKPAQAVEVDEPAKGEPVAEPVHAGDDVPDHTVEQEAPVKKAARRAVPVRRQPIAG